MNMSSNMVFKANISMNIHISIRIHISISFSISMSVINSVRIFFKIMSICIVLKGNARAVPSPSLPLCCFVAGGVRQRYPKGIFTPWGNKYQMAPSTGIPKRDCCLLVVVVAFYCCCCHWCRRRRRCCCG